MTAFFVDTSALAKRYLSEIGSGWVQNWIIPVAGNTIIISEIAIPEMRSLLARLVRERNISLTDAQSAKYNFLRHVRQEYRAITLSRRGLIKAGDLTETHILRALDAIHLAAALEAQAVLGQQLTLVSADKQLLSAAQAEGFITDTPYLHP